MGRNLDTFSGFQQIPGMPILLQQSVLVHDTSASSNLQFTHKEDHHSWSTITPKKDPTVLRFGPHLTWFFLWWIVGQIRNQKPKI